MFCCGKALCIVQSIIHKSSEWFDGTLMQTSSRTVCKTRFFCTCVNDIVFIPTACEIVLVESRNRTQEGDIKSFGRAMAITTYIICEWFRLNGRIKRHSNDSKEHWRIDLNYSSRQLFCISKQHRWLEWSRPHIWCRKWFQSVGRSGWWWRVGLCVCVQGCDKIVACAL